MSISRKTKESADFDDILIGRRIKLARTEAGLSQGQVGDGLNVSYQQVQKWEAGVNRITAARLIKFAHLIGKPVSYLVSDLIEDERFYITKKQHDTLETAVNTAEQIKADIMALSVQIDVLRMDIERQEIAPPPQGQAHGISNQNNG